MRSKFRHVFFDIDSTIVTIEGFDYLSNNDPEIVAMTQAAMNGDVPLQETYATRMERLRPGRDEVLQLGAAYVRSLVPDAVSTFEALRSGGADIHLISTGILPAIYPLAEHLGVPQRAVHAVQLQFDEQGRFADFDRRSPLTRSGGKELTILDVRVRSKGATALIGDGVPDFEAAGAVDLFIGFGGVRVRPRLKDFSPVYVTDASIAAVLPYLMEES